MSSSSLCMSAYSTLRMRWSSCGLPLCSTLISSSACHHGLTLIRKVNVSNLLRSSAERAAWWHARAGERAALPSSRARNLSSTSIR